MKDTNKKPILTDKEFFEEFRRGYIEAALWSSQDSLDGEDVNLDSIFDYFDLIKDPVFKEITDRDISNFLGEAYIEVSEAYHLKNVTASQIAHDFWLTRAGHGCGFWDRPELYGKELSDKLTKLSQEFGANELYIGDDKKLYWIGDGNKSNN